MILRGATFKKKKLNQKHLKSLKKPTWADLGVTDVETKLADVMRSFDAAHPEKSVNALASIYASLAKIKDAYWREEKQKQCKHMTLALENIEGVYSMTK